MLWWRWHGVTYYRTTAPRVLCVGRGEAGACSQGDNRCSPRPGTLQGAPDRLATWILPTVRVQDNKIHSYPLILTLSRIHFLSSLPPLLCWDAKGSKQTDAVQEEYFLPPYSFNVFVLPTL